MSATRFLFTVLGVWVVYGAIQAWLMATRGHSFSRWLAAGCILGPLSLPIALDARRRAAVSSHAESITPDRAVRVHPAAEAELCIAAAYDGSDGSIGALAEALELLERRVRRCVLVSVGDHESIAREHDVRGAHPLHDSVTRAVEAAQREHPEVEFAAVLAHGVAGDEIVAAASREGAALIAIGAQGTGSTGALLGSTARAVLAASRVPVLVGSLHERSRARRLLDAIRLAGPMVSHSGLPV